MLSKKAKYVIKTLILLGKQAEGVLLLGSQIAEMENIPKKSLESILVELKKAGYIFSKKGTGGGYLLAKPLTEIFLIDVVRFADGPIAQVSCASAFHYRRCEECSVEETCSIRDLYLEIWAADVKILSSTSIADMIKKEVSLSKKMELVLS
ncbi:RrF2 family transcriptional regulator [Mucilaginibacter agri]|uniref:Rrf2 family transcriptional regulator n=1 Tax=Mucilaginibacter agri TaxID=2695265 RepID=A0A966DTV9_9SPHI|nr:Rrf2 family transcriptional regulator [Mucilaginibacter agri]NCD69757.1 Rrf2 family transcriptional regulator [Mucilaginibacter agri]